MEKQSVGSSATERLETIEVMVICDGMCVRHHVVLAVKFSNVYDED